MKEKTYSCGDLLYAPSGVYLYKLNDGEISNFIKLDEPRSLLFIEAGERLGQCFYSVLYENESWAIKPKDVYGVENEHG